MANQNIFPMAYTIKPDLKQTIYYIGFPKAWKERLFELEKKRKFSYKLGQSLPTTSLQKMVDSWMDNIVKVKPIFEESDDSLWLSACSEFTDKQVKSLLEMIKIWVSAIYIADTKVMPAIKEKAKLLCTEMQVADLLALKREEEKLLSNQDGTVNSEAYKAIPLIAINRLQGKEFVVNGTRLHLSYIGENELISQPLRDEKSGHAYSYVVQFSVQTVPPHRQALLLCDISIRRWIYSRLNKEKPIFAENGIAVYVKTSSNRYYPIMINFNGTSVDWKKQDLECYNLYEFTQLPSINDLINMVEASTENFLLSYKNGMKGFVQSKIGTGVPVGDKVAIYEQLFKMLEEDVGKASCGERVTSRASISCYHTPSEYPSRESFREWASLCCEANYIRFELYGSQDEEDQKLLSEVKAKIEEDFGDNSADSKLRIEIVLKNVENMCLELTDKGVQAKIDRREKIIRYLGKTEEVVGCICCIPAAEKYNEQLDPKGIVRNAFASTGRVVQFINPVQEKGNIKQKIDHAVYDLYRQIGLAFLIDVDKYSKQKFSHVKCVGMHVCTQVQGRLNKGRFLPVFISVDLLNGKTRVQCAAFGGSEISYRQACIKMAELYWKDNLEDLCKQASFSPVKQKMIELKNKHEEDSVILMVHSDGNTRPLWRGIADKVIGDYTADVKYCPSSIDVGDKSPYEMSLLGTGIRILRIRTSGEVPDYYTCKSEESKKEDAYASCSGVFKYNETYWSIAAKPNNPVYNASLWDSRIDHPRNDYAEKDMIEIYPIQLQQGDESDKWVQYASNLCKLSIQYDQKTILPLPLHLAKTLVEDYLFKT